MNQEQFDELFSAYLSGACSKDQLALLLDIVKAPENRDWVQQRIRQQLAQDALQSECLPPEQLAALQQQLGDNLERIFRRIDQDTTSTKSRTGTAAIKVRRLSGQKWLVGVAAAITLFAGVFWWNRSTSPAEPEPQSALHRPDFKPGKSAAILTVDGGREIYLDSNSSAVIARQGSSLITSRNGQINYTTGAPTGKTVYNTLTTSRGNQYNLVLPDGTKVWLNAASSIRYPVAFTGATREVQAEGELYFEVKHNDKQPFIVKAGGQVIEDLGTCFNVHAYGNEQTFSTTLVEGAVKIAGRVLSPGTQARIKAGKLSVHRVDTTQVVAWKNGLFAFHQTPVKEVLRQIARWYDVEVQYQGPIPELRFGGKISRRSNASVVLTILEKSGLDFKVEGRKIIVTGTSQP